MPCNKCGKCCKVLIFEMRYTTEAQAFYNTRGLATFVNEVNMMQVVVPHRCPYLQEDNLCKIHDDPMRNSSCRRYTGEKLFHIFPKCGFAKE